MSAEKDSEKKNAVKKGTMTLGENKISPLWTKMTVAICTTNPAKGSEATTS